MPTVVLKLFAGQGTERTDGQSKQRLNASPLVEHNKEAEPFCIHSLPV